MVVLRNTVCFFVARNVDLASSLRAFASDSAGKLDVLGHDCHTLGVDSGKIRVFEEAYKVCLSGLLEC